MEYPTVINWKSQISILVVLSGIFQFFQISIDHSVCKQWKRGDTDQNLWRLVCVCTVFLFSTFMSNGIPHFYQLEEPIFNFRGVEWYFSFLYRFQSIILYANSGDVETLIRICGVWSGSALFAYFHKKDTKLIWVKIGNNAKIKSFFEVCNEVRFKPLS